MRIIGCIGVGSNAAAAAAAVAVAVAAGLWRSAECGSCMFGWVYTLYMCVRISGFLGGGFLGSHCTGCPLLARRKLANVIIFEYRSFIVYSVLCT